MNLACTLLGIWCGALTGPAYILDGDTISIGYHHVRLAGIDAEELDEPHGELAKAHMEQLTRGATVTCKPNGERSYHRLVATCYVGKMDIGAQMVKDGMALDCFRYSKGAYRRLEPVGIRSKLIQKGYC